MKKSKRKIVNYDQHPDKDERWYWPLNPRFNFFYKMWILIHCIYTLIFSVGRVAFEEKPKQVTVILESYLTLVFFFDMVRCFTMPITNSSGQVVYKRSTIMCLYIKKWFWFDFFAFYPLAYLRYNSNYSDGSFNDWDNFLLQNFERLPRFYKAMLLIQLPRARFTLPYMKDILDYYKIAIPVQQMVITAL